MTEIPCELEDAYRAVRESCGLFTRLEIDLIQVRGDDRRSWLQGQITNDMRKLTPVDPLDFVFCTPTGQIVSIGRCWEQEDSLLLGVPSVTTAAVLDRFQRMVVMEDVEAELISNGRKLLSVQGPHSHNHVRDVIHGARGLLALPSDRCGQSGIDLWTSEPELEALIRRSAPIADAAYEPVRIEAGIPDMLADISPKTLASELGAAFESTHISYAKGCYTGQEVLMRIHSRGHTNWIWTGVRSAIRLTAGEQLKADYRESVGTITSAAYSPRSGHIGAARVRNEAIAGEEVTVETEQGTLSVELRAFPLYR